MYIGARRWYSIRMLTSYLKKYLYWAIAAALIVIIVSVYRLAQNPLSGLQTLQVRTAPFAQQVRVSGTVEAAQEVDLGFAQSGRISRTYASVGDDVRSGAVIAEMDNGDLRAALAQRKAALDTARASLAALKAGTREEKVAVAKAQVESDKIAILQAKASLLDAIETAYTHADDAVHNKADQFFSNPNSFSPSLNFTTSNSQLALSLTTNRVVAEQTLRSWRREIESLKDTDDLERAYVRAREYASAIALFVEDCNSALNSVVYGTNVTSSEVSGYVTNIAAARANLNTSLSSLTSAITAVRSANALLEKNERNLALEQAGATKEDLEAEEARVEAARADVQSAQAQLEKTMVVAPFSGTLTRMDARAGEIVSPSDAKIAMISKGLFEIETYIPEVQITSVRVGNGATTTLDAYGDTVHFAAKVIAIDPAETVKNGVSTYKTTLQFLNDDERIRPGMTATVLITTDLVPGAIVVPRGALFERAGSKAVQVVRDDRVVEISVQVAPGESLGNVQVLSGLQDGDTIVLNPSVVR